MKIFLCTLVGLVDVGLSSATLSVIEIMDGWTADGTAGETQFSPSFAIDGFIDNLFYKSAVDLFPYLQVS